MNATTPFDSVSGWWDLGVNLDHRSVDFKLELLINLIFFFIILVIACASVIAGVAVICLTFLVILSVVLRIMHFKRTLNHSERELDYAEPDLNIKHRETSPDYAEPDTIITNNRASPAIFELDCNAYCNRAAVIAETEENRLDPAYAVVEDVVHSEKSEFRMDQNSSYAPGGGDDGKVHLYEEIVRLQDNCAYGHHVMPTQPQSPPETE